MNDKVIDKSCFHTSRRFSFPSIPSLVSDRVYRKKRKNIIKILNKRVKNHFKRKLNYATKIKLKTTNKSKKCAKLNYKERNKASIGTTNVDESEETAKYLITIESISRYWPYVTRIGFMTSALFVAYSLLKMRVQ